jgi:hypothetical protein
MRALYVTSEIYPLTKTGGLADVSAALPSALRQLGVASRESRSPEQTVVPPKKTAKARAYADSDKRLQIAAGAKLI